MSVIDGRYFSLQRVEYPNSINFSYYLLPPTRRSVYLTSKKSCSIIVHTALLCHEQKMGNRNCIHTGRTQQAQRVKITDCHKRRIHRPVWLSGELKSMDCNNIMYVFAASHGRATKDTGNSILHGTWLGRNNDE